MISNSFVLTWWVTKIPLLTLAVHASIKNVDKYFTHWKLMSCYFTNKGPNFTRYKQRSISLPAGCIFPGVNDLTKSSGVINTSLSSPTCTTFRVAKYLNTLSGVLYCLIRFSYSIIWRTKQQQPRMRLRCYGRAIIWK